MQTTQFDLAVIGAGPGGAAAALAAAALGHSVVVLDPMLERRAAGAPPKPCGEGMMPAGADALVRLGLDPEVLGRPFPGVRYVAGGARPLDLDFPAAGLAVHRSELQAALDARLRAEPGIHLVAAAARVERTAEGFTLRWGDGEGACARTLVAADGLTGRAAAWLRDGDGAGPHLRPGRTGFRVHCAARAPLERVEVHFGECEMYLTPLPATPEAPRGRVNVVLLFDALPHGVRGGDALLEYALQRHPAARRVLGRPLGRVEGRALDVRRPSRVSDGDSFLVGDAGGGVDPVLGCGVTVALRTGLEAAHAAHARLTGARPRRVARDYSRAYAAETRARRRVAGFLIALSGRPRLARAVVAIARLLPTPTRGLVSLAARVDPLRLAVGALPSAGGALPA